MFAFLTNLVGSINYGLTLSNIASENANRPEAWASLMGLQPSSKQAAAGPERTGQNVPIEIRERIAA